MSALIWAFAVLAILGIFSINLGPLIAGAGIAGIAVGLGAQQLVKDCIAGFFILLEDQCGVGDEIDVGPAIGTVESITLRATTVRDGVGHGVDRAQRDDPADRQQEPRLVAGHDRYDGGQRRPTRRRGRRDRARRRRGVGTSRHRPKLLEPIAVPGVESLDKDGAVVRVTVRTTAGDNAQVMRTLRAALTRELDAAGIGSDA